MKIGIVTHHTAHNYGAMLQAYALQRYLKDEYNYEVKNIHLRTKAGIKAYRIFKKPNRIIGLIWEFIKFFHYPQLKRKHIAFENFLENYLDKTKLYKSYEELETYPPELDCYISGSDQVFSPMGKEINAYYLNFGDDETKRIAYAPSFGYKTIPEEKKDLIRKLLNRFDHLSAREVSGCKIIEELTGEKVPNVLDPVFLLEPDQYRKISKPLKLKYKKYILCYSLVGMKKQIPLAMKVKELTGLPIVLISSSALLPIKGVDKIVRDAGPREFLWLFDNASFVVTDSFHGTAFSLIFRKNFFSTIAMPLKADRIYSILNEVGLNDRIIEDPKEIKKDKLTIDYKTPNERLQNKINISKDYLQKALKDEN